MTARPRFDWSEFLVIARYLDLHIASFPSLHPHGASEEAVTRCVANRAYYAALGHALRYAEHNGYRVQYGASDHGQVRAYLRSRGAPRSANRLRDLCEMREKCDYYALIANSQPELRTLRQTSIEAAAWVIANLTLI